MPVRSLIAVPLFLAAIGSFGSGDIPRHPNSSPSPAQNAQVIEVTAKKYEYKPPSIHVKQGTKVQLKINSTDHAHGFKIGEFPDGSDRKGSPGLTFTSSQDCWKIEKGQSETIEFVAQTPGTYSFKCCVHCGWGHKGMKGELVVDP
jgi:heme/copper-type cytochrome/quinol oxidase subunit 2